MAAPVGSAKMEGPPAFELNMDSFITEMRNRVKNYIYKHHYESAIFWADKLVDLSDAVEDLFWYAQTMYYTGQYHRAIHLLNSRKLIKQYPACRYLAAKCYYECKEWQEALNVLDMLDMSFTRASSTLNSSLGQNSAPQDEKGGLDNMLLRNCDNSICLLRGKIYEAMDNRSLAADCYREALHLDVFCFEAFDLLVSHHMLTATEEQDLINSLPFDTQCSPGAASIIKGLYQSKMKKYNCPKEAVISEVLAPLADNLDVIVSTAEQHLYNCNFRTAHKITSRVLTQDPYNSQCLPIHIAVLVELKHSNDLFYLGHKLVDSYPDKCISWFAVGCYYMLTENFSFARWYLSKATTLERAHGPSWLAYGHTFGMNNDHDQAMAAYFTASQIMRGCHLPVLYIGLEYGLTNNSKLAERFFSEARGIAPTDPFVLHEMGVIHFGNGNLAEAERLFCKALGHVQACTNEMLEERWEPLINNLGHVARKQHRYQDALDYHKQALVLVPQQASTYSAIGFVYALMGNHAEAVNYFHKALGLRKDDTFSTTMLTNSMEALMAEVSPCDGAEEEAKFPIPSAPRSLKQLQTPYSQQARQTKLSQPSSDSHISGEDDSLLHDEGELDESDLPPGLFTPSSGDTPTETDARVAEQNDSSLSEEVDMEDCP
ncbi:hypothetical protein RRG08_022006 [Elysia crispata]|uniref:Cell division cycle protein 16 homolog n=1 Tax=Elysia crispata TaxID=231223 RepID=A0AAE1A9Q6_9GAST|nr:hypothetical protein RRG08_022006 [Elysia crispata]